MRSTTDPTRWTGPNFIRRLGSRVPKRRREPLSGLYSSDITRRVAVVRLADRTATCFNSPLAERSDSRDIGDCSRRGAANSTIETGPRSAITPEPGPRRTTQRPTSSS
ncbi:hypothetical protein NJ7G_0121 [Natrinema sp. J7-2]|nr:hypothetical protein NJ7G_0121 [Natrinema sp. J7-2]